MATFLAKLDKMQRGDFLTDHISLLTAHLDYHLFPDIHCGNLGRDTVRGDLLATELCVLLVLIWPFTSWPGSSWLISSCLGFHLFWVLA